MNGELESSQDRENSRGRLDSRVAASRQMADGTIRGPLTRSTSHKHGMGIKNQEVSSAENAAAAASPASGALGRESAREVLKS